MLRKALIDRIWVRLLWLAAALILNAQCSTLNAQALSRHEVGVNAGMMNYLGDLNNQSMLGRPNPGYGVFYRYSPDNRWSFSLLGAYGHIEGGNPKGLEGVRGDWLEWRNLSFYSYVGEVALRAEFNFFPLGHGTGCRVWTPYLFAGVGAFMFNPTALYQDPLTGESRWVDLQPLGTEGQGTAAYPDRRAYNLIQPMVPFGMGLRVKPLDLFALSIEYGFRKTWTDYLDDCSLTYAGSEALSQLAHGELSSAMADRSVTPNAPGILRGDDSLDDWYAYLNISLTFRLDKVFWWVGKKKCDNKNY